MSESLIAYLLHGVLKALEYLHRMGYVHRLVHANTNISNQPITWQHLSAFGHVGMVKTTC